MRLGLMPNPNAAECNDFSALGRDMDELTPEQHIRLQSILSSWGLQKHGLPVDDVRRAVKKVRQNWP